MYTFLVAPEWTQSARAGGSGPEFLPHSTFSLEGSNLVEGHGGSRVDEGNELSRSSLERNQGINNKGKAYRNVLILHVPDALQYTTPDSVTQVLGGGLGVDVPKVNCPVQRLVSVQATKAVHPVHPVHPIHTSKVGGEGQVGGHGRPEVALTLDGREGSVRDERLGRSCLRSLCGGLLRLGNVGASIFAIVDALPRPRRLSRESVHDLHSEGCEYHENIE